MTNLRIVEVKAISSTNLVAKFTAPLASDLTLENVTITSETVNVPDATVLSCTVIKDTLDIICQPMTEQAVYTVTFVSNTLHRFKDLNGTAFLNEDGKTNLQLIIGPTSPDNPFLLNLKNVLRDQIYDLEDGTLVTSLLKSFAGYFAKALYDIRQVRNENYLTKLVVDEAKVRGSGPSDHLLQEGAYEILRVGKFKENYVTTGELDFDVVPTSIISLRQLSVINEDLTLSSSDVPESFNINTFTLNVAKSPVIKLDKIIFFYNGTLPNGNTYYEYSIDTLGYQILDERYDPESAFKYITLSENQFRLSEKVLEDSNFSLNDISNIKVSYTYKNLGRMIDPNSVIISKSIPITREVIQPLENIFNIKFAPVIDSNDNVATINGIMFLDPNGFPSLTKRHPAFLNELTFSFEALPTKPGDYSVDYTTGTVYVFGADYTNNGTGPYPPLVNYTYRMVFRSLIDYVYDSDSQDIVTIKNRELIGNSAKIHFTYEDVLVPGIDYKAQVHQETLLERVNNRYLPNISAIEVTNSPVTNVFRLFNETQGVVYPIQRWADNKIYFQSPLPPNIENATAERVSFQSVLNDILFVNQETINTNGVRIFRILLSNDNIMAGSEDSLGSSFNTSLTLSDANIFVSEFYFDPNIVATVNLNRITIGTYQVDYKNGIVYVGVQSDQDYNVGTASYKRGYIAPAFPHVLNTLSIYYRRNIFQPKDNDFAYESFGEGFIVPSTFDVSDEQLLNGDTSFPLYLLGGKVGAFISTVFTAGVTSNIKSIRSVYEYKDLNNNASPINFAEYSSALDKEITVATKNVTTYQVVEKIGSNYFVNTGFNLSYLSSNITMTFSVVRLSDSVSLWDSNGSYTLGSPIRLHLPNDIVMSDGDAVMVTVQLTINNDSRIVVDYNKGDFFVDYTYLADELVVSYEYGDNVLDFRESNISEETNYFVTYRVGALRDALLKNFGTLIDIPLLNVFDGNFERERYREALIAAMSSFIKGPTIESMSQIIETITHIKPEIIESVFQNWSLGSSSLFPQPVATTGDIKFLKAKFGDGVLIDDPLQTLKFPMSSNLSLNQGTITSWVIPQWNGIDNDATLTFTITKDGYSIGSHEIFVGAAELHPTIVSNSFTVSKKTTVSPFGKPNKNHPGVFIYIDRDGYGVDGYTDGYGTFDRWYVDVANSGTGQYNVKIVSDGEYFDAKATIPLVSGSVLRTGVNSIQFNTSGKHQAISFVSDINHYFLDCGKDKRKNRISLYKDASGFLNFRVLDRLGTRYEVSSDVSKWKLNESHHIAASWILNSENERDELHLFIDGFEAPNIERFSDRIDVAFGRKIRNINPEEIVSVINKNIVSGNDLKTIIGSPIVTSALVFSSAGILAGDTIYIDEFGFNENGYSIVTVNGQSLTLSSPVPATLSDANFSVNKITIPVSTRVGAYPNVEVTLIHPYYTGTGDSGISGNLFFSTGTDFSVISKIGDLLRVDAVGYDQHYIITDISGHTVTLNQTLPVASNLTFYIYTNVEVELPGKRALFPYYQFNQDGYGSDELVLLNGGLKGDLLLIRSLGLNFKRVHSNYYLWGDSSNIIKTSLPPPLSLDDVKIYKIVLPPTTIGTLQGNASFIGNNFTTSNLNSDQPSISSTGRTLTIKVSGSNVDYSTPILVTINGNVSEVLTFNANGSSNTLNKYTSLTNISVTGRAISSAKPVLSISVQEYNSITTAENSAIVPVIRFSYQVYYGTTLQSAGGTTVSDAGGNFSSIDVGNYIHIFSGNTYLKIESVSDDHKSATVSPASAVLVNAEYEILNVTTERSGLQNGFFTFELLNVPKQPYNLTKGGYAFDYDSYISARFDPIDGFCYLGSDIAGVNQAHSIIDEVKIGNVLLTDTRIGETIGAGEDSITKEFNSIKQSDATSTTLMLLHFEDKSLINSADFYSNPNTSFIQSGSSVNDTFGQSVMINKQPLIIPNDGILNSTTEGTIEFWVSPLIDTANDPNYRFYFDAAGIVTEKVISTNFNTIELSGRAGSILSIKLQFGNTTQEYSGASKINQDTQTIHLVRNLPHQSTPVMVSYVPIGFKGDRISIYKDPYGYVNFTLRGTGIDYQVRTQVFWAKNSWHRLKATYKINGGKNLDEIRFFVDGFERGNISFGRGLLFGPNLIFGQSFVGKSNIISNIKFTDAINQFNIGSDYANNFIGNCRIDNLRVSVVSRPGYIVFGESVDVNYNVNTNVVFPVTEDLFTTYLFDFNSLKTLNTDFALLKNKNFGLFDFSINIFDSFSIVKNSDKVKEVLESLIKTLKPANSRVFIKYL